ncbi:MAG: DNA primase [Chthoniobacterales bacterium]|nr:DNA primase [Chthoniobacterales bacterium]
MPRIAEESIEQVAAANDIVEVIGSYFPLKRAGTSWRALCPFHREKSPSFHVSPQKQAYYCFGCGAGGSMFKFVMEYERVDFVTAVQRLAQRAGITIIEEASSPEDGRRRQLRDRLLDLHRLAAAWFAQNLLRSPGGSGARDYLKSRAISSEIAREWQLGYAPDSWDAFLGHARQSGFRDEELRSSGLFSGGGDGPLRDRFRQRLMFPICNDYGEVIAFSGRVLPPSEDPAKYVNSPETPLFTKGRALFGLHKARRPLAEAGVAIVCEGQLDLIRIFESGMQNVVAPQGTAFTPAQARLLRRYAETAILCFDSDRAGRTAVERSLPILLAAGFGVRVAALAPGDDPDSLIRRDGAESFRTIVDKAPDYFDFAVDEASTSGAIESAAAKTVLVRKLAGFAASLPDAVARESLAARLGPRFAISPQAFLAAVPKKAPAETEPVDELPASEPRTKEPDPDVLLLIHTALVSLEARQWLAAQDTADVLANLPGLPLLQQCLASSFDPSDTTATQTFIATLDPRGQSVFASLLMGRPPTNPVTIARETIQTLRCRPLEAERKALTAQIHQAGLLPETIERLQSQVIDINRRIAEIAGSQ